MARNEPTAKIDTNDPTLRYANSMSNKFSQTPRLSQNVKHISKNKVTGGNRKRLSRSRAEKQNVEFFPEFLFVTDPPSTPRAQNNLALDGTVSTSHVDTRGKPSTMVSARWACRDDPKPRIATTTNNNAQRTTNGNKKHPTTPTHQRQYEFHV